MSEKTNYEKAKELADKIDEEIIAVLQSGKSFKVEAGAGSGKTYSLHGVVEWIDKHKAKEYKRNGKHVACLTYTNAAVEVIASRIFQTASSFHQQYTVLHGRIYRISDLPWLSQQRSWTSSHLIIQLKK